MAIPRDILHTDSMFWGSYRGVFTVSEIRELEDVLGRKMSLFSPHGQYVDVRDEETALFTLWASTVGRAIVHEHCRCLK